MSGSRKRIEVAYNAGNAATKIAITGAKTIVSNRGLVFDPDPADGPAFTIDGRCGVRGEERKPWQMYTGGLKPYDVQTGTGKADYALPILIGELWPHLEADNDIQVQVLCHDPAKLAPAIRTNMEGAFFVTFGGVRKRVTITVLDVLREGRGLQPQFGATETVVTVDGGGGTVVFTKYVNGKVSMKSGVAVLDDWGMVGLVNHLKNSNYDSWLGDNPTVASIQRYLAKPPKDASPHYQQSIDSYIDELMRALSRQAFNLYVDVDRVVLIGGLGGIQAWRESFTRFNLPGLTFLAKPQTADVEGVLTAKFGRLTPAATKKPKAPRKPKAPKAVETDATPTDAPDQPPGLTDREFIEFA